MAPPARPDATGAYWRGEVTRVAGGRVFVRVFHVAGTRDELEATVAQIPAGLVSQPDGGAGHTHLVAPVLAAGDKVAVLFLEGQVDYPLIIARLPG